MDTITLGRHIKDARNRRDMTAEQLAEAADISPKSLWQIESGRRSPSLNLLIRLCRILNVSSDSLLEKELQGDLEQMDSSYVAYMNVVMSLSPEEFDALKDITQALIRCRH